MTLFDNGYLAIPESINAKWLTDKQLRYALSWWTPTLAPTSKYLKSLERNISLTPYCTSIIEEEDLNDLSEDYIIRLYDITVDLEILIDNSKKVIEKDLCSALEEILWKWKN